MNDTYKENWCVIIAIGDRLQALISYIINTSLLSLAPSKKKNRNKKLLHKFRD